MLEFGMEEEHTPTTIYINAYRSFLRAEGTMTIDQILNLYKNMKPSIHHHAGDDQVDVEALMYSTLRLPQMIHQISLLTLAQIGDSFRREGYELEFWEEVHAPARRRKMYHDGKDQLAAFLNSVTDLDDIVGLLTAFEIEWNKIHARLSKSGVSLDAAHANEVQESLGIDDENWARIQRIWGTGLFEKLTEMREKPVHFTLKLLRGHYVDYKKAAQRWFENIIENTRYKDLRNRPLYFVSSNTHSLVNNLTGWVTGLEDELISYLKENKSEQLLAYWQQIQEGEHNGSRENFLWYILKKYEAVHPDIKKKRLQFEEELGIDFIDARHYLDINAQVFSVADMKKTGLAKKINIDMEKLESDALVLNIDYPLGLGAYMVLSTLLYNVNDLRGVYILGKASFLHANLGDIGLPTKVYDTYSKNTFIFTNAFTKDYFAEFKTGSVLTNQKVVSTKGTFLHPAPIIQKYFIDGYTLVEMEDGPYLSGLYETTHFDRYPEKTTVTMLDTPIDIGIIHYASDTPFTKAITLGTRNLGYEGVEATYVSSLAILKRIVEMEMR
ncbi:hypothetical protein KBD81_04640 [Candidatus Woesebacteria bacterium]|nr:hypothetical protein [Candidatus Woesebacteria bacterium]